MIFFHANKEKKTERDEKLNH